MHLSDTASILQPCIQVLPVIEGSREYNICCSSYQEYPVQSVICEPTEGTSISRDDSELTVKGYAWSGGGRGIVRVDVSVDGGQSWQEASLHSTPQPRHRQWAWTLWEASLPIPEDSKELGILCKATDTSHNCQPETAAGIWNLRGLIHNAWHKVTVPVE